MKQKNSGVSYIELDRNEQLKGVEFIEPLHKAIQKKTPIKLSYQSFKAEKPQTNYLFPYLLKEYNNRWFLLCAYSTRAETLIVLALDRMVEMEEYGGIKYLEAPVDVFRYFDEVIGVSKTGKMRGRKILLRVQKSQVQYFITKPIHPSQTISEETEGWVNISLNVIWNYELEREILGLGEVVEVLKPLGLRKKIQERLEKAIKLY